jgi:hypothetical protein
MTRRWTIMMCASALALAMAGGEAFGQTSPPAGGVQNPPAGRGQRGARAGGARPELPPLAPNMNQQQLQTWLDTYAVIQAERELQLTAEQYPQFVTRLRRLQDVRRRHLAERRRLLADLRTLVEGTAAGRDEAIDGRLRALDDNADRQATQLRAAYGELDAVLTPWQRGRFRLFEDQLERRKVDLLSKIGGGRGGGPGPGGGQ